MTDSKAKRVIVAGTVGAVLLFIILISVMVYQLLAIKHQTQLKDEYDAKIAEYEELIKTGEDSIKTRSMRWWIERRARELGYIYSTDSPLD